MSANLLRSIALGALTAAAAAGAGPVTTNCTPTTLPQVIGVVVSVACAPSGGIAPYSWSIPTGSLPPGLSQNTKTGAITGTLVDPAGPFTFTVEATDSNNLTGTQPYSGTTVDPVTVTCALPNGPLEVGVAYSNNCSASGGTPPYTWSVPTGPNQIIPPGLTVSAAGLVTDQPTASMASYSYRVQAADSSTPVVSNRVAFTGAIAAAVTIATTSPLPGGATGSSYSQQFSANPGVPSYTWSASQAPAGLTMSAAGLLSGKPTATGSFSFPVSVTDSAGGSTSGTFSLTVTAGLTITTASPLPAATIGVSYTQTFGATGGSGTGYTWSATGQPTWLVLSPSGVLTGTPPSSAVTSSFTVQVTDSNNNTTSGTFTLPVTLAVTTSSPLPPATISTAYNQTLTAIGGTGVYTWSETGSLPAGLTLSPAGVISGQPTTSAVSSTFTAKVTDSSSTAATASLTIPVTLAITTQSPLPAATVGAAYTQTLAADGGAGGYTWTATGLPSWLTLSTAGVLTSTSVPATASTATFTAKVTDSAKNSVSATLMVPVPLAILTALTLPPATVNLSYTETLTAGGGAGGYTWTATGLPLWLTLSTAGVLTGTPTATGTVTFPVTVTDSSLAKVTEIFTLTVNGPQLTITTSGLASGAVGAAYNQTLNASGGTPPYTWSLAAGSTLPTGLSLSPAGVINGAPQNAGTFSVTITVTDATSTAVSKTFSIVITGGLTITTASPLPNATVGVTYSDTLAASGGTAPYTWAITTGSLPAPLVLNGTTGQITGKPAAIATSAFTVTVTDANNSTVSKGFTLSVVAPPIINTASLPNGATGAAYSQTLSASGGTTPYTWTISTGTLPVGLTLSPAGAIAGNPTVAGTSTFTVQLTDATGVTASKQLTLTIVTGLTILTASPLPPGEVNIAYSQMLTASGGAAPYTWALTGGALPGGLTLAANGAIAGKPVTAGAFSFTVQATDSNHATADATLAVTIAAAVTISTGATLGEGSVGTSYSQTLTATGGETPYAWSLTSGTLPPGLTLSSAGSISGTPSATGASTFTVKVTDTLGATASQQFTITVAIGLTISTQATLPGGTVNVVYSEQLQASGGTGPYTWSVPTGTPPPGVTLRADGNLTGLPTAAGTYTFTAEVTDSLKHTAAELMSLTIAPALSITTTALPGGAVGAAYSQAVMATGGTAPYTWTISSGTLPGGLSLSAAGAITGTPTAAGTLTFTVKVTDSVGATSTKSLSITITSGLTITTAAALPAAAIDVAYSQTLAAEGGTGPYSWAVTAGALPAGVTLSPAGAVSGTPTVSGTFLFTATVTDSASATASRQFTLAVGGGLAITTVTLPAGQVGVAYSQTLAASGGTAPYTFSKSSGTLPPGLALSGTTLSGTPSAVGSYTFTIQVTDSASATATQLYTVTITTATLSITSTTLPAGAVGTAYSATLTASGGIPPYTWAAQNPVLPPGLSLDPASGTISGTPSNGGNATVTFQVTDHAGATALTSISIVVLSGSFSGLPATAASTEQVTFTLNPSVGYATDIAGTVTLAFQPDSALPSPAVDPAIQFSTGGTNASFTIPAGTSAPVSFTIQTGSVAGTITLSVQWQSGGASLAVPSALTQTVQIAAAAPVITGITASTTSSGFQVVVTGYSNTRDLSQAVVQFTPASGQTLQTSTLTVSLSGASTAWFGSSGSDQFGGQFVLTMPFSVSNGSASAISSVSVQLVNSQGTSSSGSGSL